MISRTSHHTAHHFICLCIIAVLCSVIYSNSLNSPFVFDDLDNIQNNRYIRLSELGLSTIHDAAFKSLHAARPLPNISFALNYYFGKYDVSGYHIINILIHLLNGVLVYFITLLTFRQLHQIQNITDKQTREISITLISLFTASIFVAHPIQVQSVTYIVQRMNSMAAMFYFMSLLLYILGRRSDSSNRRWISWAGCLVSGILALGSKENAATLPLIILLYEWYFFRNLDFQWLKQNSRYVATLIVLLLFIGIYYLGDNPADRIFSTYDNRDFSIGERVLTQFRVVVFYIYLVVFPLPGRMNLLHDIPVSHSFVDPVTTLLSCLFLAGLFVLSIYLAKRDRLISFCILWFFINLSIESSVIGLELIFEHRLYLPMFGIALLFSYLLFSLLSGKPRLLAACGIALIILLGTGTYARNKVWANDLLLWSDVVTKNPDSYRAHINLGLAFNLRGNKSEALKYFGYALSLKPNSSIAHNNLGTVLRELGQLDKSILHYYQALKYKPGYAEAHYNLGIAYSDQGNFQLAVNHYLKALKINPYYSGAHFNLGNTLARQGDQEAAIYHYRKVIEQDNEAADAYINLGIALAGQGDYKEAITQFTRVLQIDPQYIPGYFNLGMAQLLTGKKMNACSNFQHVFRMQPDFPNIRQVVTQHCIQQDK
jgi:protein O-mannosyl-transferase